MRVYDLINNKKHGGQLSDEEIKFLIDGYVKGDIPDYQMSAMLMAIYFKGMNLSETTALTRAMVESGETIDLSFIDGIKVDKHSTGGVGDKTSLVLLPLMALCGLKVSKMSGRGLGHTGGTIDKLESIPGFNVNLDRDEMFYIVEKFGFAISGQTLDLVPADKKLYALRDVTATVDNLSLIASSIMSKKIASGADIILLDVKVGSGAFMKNVDDAVQLAEMMVSIGKSFGRKVGIVLSNMEEPLGFAVGNSLEVIEAVKTLSNEGPEDFTTLCVFLNATMLKLSGICDTLEEGLEKTKALLKTDDPFLKFVDFVYAQKGDTTYIKDLTKFEKSKYAYKVISTSEGYIKTIDAEKIGLCSLVAGAGRATKEEEIDHTAGVILHKKVGDQVAFGDALGVIYTNKSDEKEALTESFYEAFGFSSEPVRKNNVIIGMVDDHGFIDMRK
ncbi:MAG: Pyrimidine-nucleoside phosphorylase [Clostridiales bacterium 38_11]|nr:MAG: Pyrimidine-nucleoside phosphorylase [Clostridiales bacterium 38_11]HBH11836.1 thymidine phosphorylase [Clostridiales bacterium]